MAMMWRGFQIIWTRRLRLSLYLSNITPVIFGLFRMGKSFVRSSYGRIRACKSECVHLMSASRFPKKGVGCGVELDSFFGG